MSTRKPTHAKSIADYLVQLPADRRATISKVRHVIRKNLPVGYQEGLLYGMIAYYIPLKRFPDTYNGYPLMIAALASQKNYMALYLMGVYGHKPLADWFYREWKKTGKKLNMGKSCLRFKTIEDISLPLIGQTIGKIPVKAYLAHYEYLKGKKK